MKTAACYIVLNEADYIAYSLRSSYDAFDQIIIIEGAVKQVADIESNNGLSLDGTTKILESFPDPENKIRYKQVGVVENKIGLRRAHQELMDRDVDWVFIIDGDEAWSQKSLDNTFRLLHNEPDLVWLGVPLYNFIGDFWHLLGPQQKPPTFYRKPGDYFDRDGNSMTGGEYHERVYRNLQGVGYYQSHVVVQDAMGLYPYANGKYRKQRWYIPFDMAPEYHWIHYGFVRDRIRFEYKLGFHNVRDGGAKSYDEVDLSDRRYYIVKHGKLREKDVKAGYRWEHVPDFEHPEPFKKHLYYNMTYEEIFAMETDYLKDIEGANR